MQLKLDQFDFINWTSILLPIWTNCSPLYVAVQLEIISINKVYPNIELQNVQNMSNCAYWF